MRLCASLMRFAESFGIPVCTSFFRRAHLSMPCIRPMPAIWGWVPQSQIAGPRKSSGDLVIAVGARLNELTTQAYSLFDIPVAQMPLVACVPGRQTISAGSGARIWVSMLSPRGFRRRPSIASHHHRTDRDIAAAHQDYLDWSQTPHAAARSRSISSEILIWLRGPSPGGRHALQRRGQLRRLDLIASIAFAASPPRWLGLRLYGLWRAGGHRDEAALSAAPA